MRWRSRRYWKHRTGHFYVEGRRGYHFHKLQCYACGAYGLAAGAWWKEHTIGRWRFNPVSCTHCSAWKRAYRRGGKALRARTLYNQKGPAKHWIRDDAQHVADMAFLKAGGSELFRARVRRALRAILGRSN